MPSFSVASRTRRKAASKSPRTRQRPRAVGQRLRELAERDLARGDEDQRREPACARVGRERGADVLPVDAQATARAPMRTACVTATVIPRSLNEPVGFSPRA